MPRQIAWQRRHKSPSPLQRACGSCITQGQSALHAVIWMPAWNLVLLWHGRWLTYKEAWAQEFAVSVRQLGCDLETWPDEQRQQALQMLVHACDIGNPAKSLHSSLLWSERITAENFAQVGFTLRTKMC